MSKKILTYFLLLICTCSFAQDKQSDAVKQRVQELHKAIFIDKDSIALEKMVASTLSYGHSGGKVENRMEMIKAAIHNQSVYTNLEAKEINITVHHKTAVSRYLLTGTENKSDGSAVNLKLNILQVWVKENKEWKLLARQAVKVS